VKERLNQWEGVTLNFKGVSNGVFLSQHNNKNSAFSYFLMGFNTLA
jgi:hypothetical protein